MERLPPALSEGSCGRPANTPAPCPSAAAIQQRGDVPVCDRRDELKAAAFASNELLQNNSDDAARLGPAADQEFSPWQCGPPDG